MQALRSSRASRAAFGPQCQARPLPVPMCTRRLPCSIDGTANNGPLRLLADQIRIVCGFGQLRGVRARRARESALARCATTRSCVEARTQLDSRTTRKSIAILVLWGFLAGCMAHWLARTLPLRTRVSENGSTTDRPPAHG